MSYGYSKTLGSDSYARYCKKLNVVGLADCPYDLQEDVWGNNPTKWPDIQWGDIYSYLVETPGVYTKESMKNFRSLEAHIYFISGWVQTVFHIVTQDTCNFVFKAHVRRSWCVTEPPHHPWVAVSKDGAVIAAHCDCMAGLGESCSHVGALLFKLEAAARNGFTRLACTEVPCEWNQCFVKHVKAAPISQIKFYKDFHKEKLSKSKRQRKSPPAPANAHEQQSFISSLAECVNKPIVLSKFTETYHHFTKFRKVENTKRLPMSMASLFDEKNVNIGEPELRTKCDNLKTTCTEDEADYLCQSTVGQSNSLTWHDYRIGRVTASSAHNVMHTDLDKPARSLIKKICHPGKRELNVPAVKWGRDMETVAFNAYAQKITASHLNAATQKTGLRICSAKTYIGASPDGLVSCSCCGNGVVEIKCPYSLKDANAESLSLSKDFCLTPDLSNLKKNHPYYAQVQLQMHVHDCLYCHFVVWTTQTFIINIVAYDKDFCQNMITKIDLFWKKHCLPELFTHRLLMKDELPKQSTSACQLFCYCQKPEEEGVPMIGCDSTECKYQWFHYACVKVKRPPKGAWYCKECRKLKK